MLEVADGSTVADFPNQQAVLLHLFDGWFCHCLTGTYTGCLAHNMHNRPERASFDGGTGEL